MAKGAESKSIITNKILEAFPGSFVYDKEIRIPMAEGGETIQIKCVLTCAKTNVDAGGPVQVTSSSGSTAPAELTQAEKSEVEDLISSLGL